MSKKQGGILSKEWEKLRRQIERGRPQPKPNPKALPTSAIGLRPAVFQHRGPRGAAGHAHVRKLAAVIARSRSKSVDPISVWWDGRGWTCIDGHHRLDAYKEAGAAADYAIPVEVFEGSLSEAMVQAARSNTRDKLDMGSTEKSNTAWRIVAATDMTKAETAGAAGISESTVATMRRVHGQLVVAEGAADPLEARPVVDIRDLSWAEAKRLAEGRSAADFDYEEANEQKAQAMASAIRNAIGGEGGKYPEILARALDIYDTRVMDRIVEFWAAEDDSEDGAE